jgi:hypothetical protein
MGASPAGGGVPDSGAKLVRLRRYRSVAIGPSNRAESGGEGGSFATYVLPKTALTGERPSADKLNSFSALNFLEPPAGFEPATC